MMTALFTWSGAVSVGTKVGISGYGMYTIHEEIESFPYMDPFELGEGVVLALGPWKWGRSILSRTTVPAARGAAVVAWRASNVIRLGGATVSIGLGELLGAVIVGYALGATVGVGVSWLGWGNKGARDAFELYTGQVSAREYFSAVKQGLLAL